MVAKHKEEKITSESDCKLKTIAEMIVTVSHEINNPLQVISGVSEMLLLKDLPEDTKESIRMIIDMTERIQTAVKRIQGIKVPKTSSYTEDIDMLDISKTEHREK